MSLYPSGPTNRTITAAPEIDAHELDRALTPDPPAAPRPRPPTDAPLGEHALWMFDVGYRIGEDKPRSKHAAKHVDGDRGHRDSRHAVEKAWQQTPDANVAIRPGLQRSWTPDETVVCLVVPDADGKTAIQFIESVLSAEGILDRTPAVEHGDGKKFVLRSPGVMSTVRLLVPGCANSGHDGVELLGQGKKATAFGVHPDGDPYVWTVPLPEDPADIPMIPQALLDLPRKETIQGGGELTDDMEIRQSGGRVWTVAELRDELEGRGEGAKIGALFSPVRTDNKPGCFAYLVGDSLRIKDDAEGIVLTDGRHSSIRSWNEHPAGKLLQWRHLWVERHVQCKQYIQMRGAGSIVLPDGQRADVVVIRSDIGTGKTNGIIGIVKEFESVFGYEPSVLVLTHRMSLARNLCHRMSGAIPFINYEDMNWATASEDQAQRLVIQIDSVCKGGLGIGKLADHLHRMGPGGVLAPRVWDLVIIDESESAFRHLHGGTLRDRPVVWNLVGEILAAHATTTILADALLSDYSLEEYEGLVGHPPQRPVLFENRWLRGNNTRTVAYHVTRDEEGRTERMSTALRPVRFERPEDAEQLGVTLTVDRGMKSFWMTTERKTAKRLHRRLAKAGKSVVVITGEHDDPHDAEFLADPDAFIRNHQPDAVIVNQAVESGFTIDELYFDFGVVLARGGSSTWGDLVQMTGRVRTFKLRTFLGWVAKRGPAPWLWERSLRQAIVSGREATYGLLGTAKTPDGKWHRVPHDKRHLDSHVRTRVFECRGRANLAEDFWAYWRYHICQVIDAAEVTVGSESVVLSEDERKEHRVEARDELAAIKQEEAEALVAADPGNMTEEEARRILDAPASKVAADDKRKARKVLLETFYEHDATLDLVLEDDDARLRPRLRDNNAVLAVATGKQTVLVDHDTAVAKDGITASQSHVTLRAKLVWQVLDSLGFGVEDFNGNAKRPHEIEGGHGIALPADLADYLARRVNRDQYKLHLGIDPWRYGFGGGAHCSSTRGATSAFSNNNAPSGPTLIAEEVNLDILPDTPPANEIIDGTADVAGAAFAGPRQPDVRLAEFVRALLRTVGLKLKVRRDRTRGATRDQRYYSIDQEHTAHVRDLASAHWRRMTGEASQDVVAVGAATGQQQAQLVAGPVSPTGSEAEADGHSSASPLSKSQPPSYGEFIEEFLVA